jgi:hypothetical protein
MKPVDMIFGPRTMECQETALGLLVIHTTPMFGRNEMVLDITKEQLQEWASSGRLVQDAFPNLSAGEREFLTSGCTPEQWKQLFGGSDE